MPLDPRRHCMSWARQERDGPASGMSKNSRKQPQITGITESARRSQKRHCNFRRQLTVFVSGSPAAWKLDQTGPVFDRDDPPDFDLVLLVARGTRDAAALAIRTVHGERPRST
jgi:hypothetical protein